MSTFGNPLTLTPLHPAFGARVLGVDLKAPLAADTFEALQEAFDEHSVLVFPDQHLDTDEQVRFSALFGPLEQAITRKADRGVGLHVATISNVDADGALVPPDDRGQLFHTANQFWHTDSTFKPQTALASLLSAEQVPGSGGETEFVSTRAAFHALPARRQQALQGLWAVHDFQRSRDMVAPGLVRREVQEMLPPVARPLLRRNPRNGRTALYIASHAVCIEGMTEHDSRILLDELLAWCTRPEYIYTHRWTPGDLVMWDNRATMHRGRPWNAAVERRVMARTTVIDTHYDDEPEVRARAA
jgi:alpha-ketoglutarate-dependent 2,4-dichlorophenoxyacetate dioxygenase